MRFFCFLGMSPSNMFPEVKPRGTLRVKGQKTQFPMGPHHSPLLCLTLAGKNLPWFQGAEPDHMQVRSSTCCFPTELRTFFTPGS